MPFLSSSTNPSPSSERVWATAFNEFGQRIRHSFVRQEPYHQALVYVQGLMSEASRKNGWQVAGAVGDATPYAMQHLLDRAKWDCDGVRDALCAYVLETLATP
jgi:SRSO17 transposase